MMEVKTKLITFFKIIKFDHVINYLHKYFLFIFSFYSTSFYNITYM